MSNWCCSEAGINAQIANHLMPGMTLEQLDAAIIADVNVVPPPASLPRPTGTYDSGATLRAFYLEHCEGCSGRRNRGDCD